MTEFPISGVLRRTEATLAPLAREKGLRFRLVDSRAHVLSDAILLERIIINLLSNAIHYTPTGRVLVGCRRHNGSLRIEVRDTGPGIPEDQQQNIFGEFYRLDNPGADTGGLGLGLAIVDRLGRLLGHRVSVSSAPGKGSCFSICVPVVRPRPELDKRPIKMRRRSASTEGRLVVVIDDDPLVLEGMAGLIRSWGCSVVTGSTDGTVLHELRNHDGAPDVIISDYHLRNGTTGVEVIARLRNALSVRIPAFLISGDTEGSPRRDAQTNGYALLHKPIDPDTLRFMLWQIFKTNSARVS